ncbi:hypothetical protein VC83_05775 [Pseudogymnoascus destructans]|uniref:Glycosyl hydrolase family 31 C-terminal domain-containing protein n=2 Tax=Pseudogymnoascus destructans TaxID=655981 RepID=L8FU56_PSED2|nr:uncharacterized protein VC83_05775 [Pseudogymnoascus destructans]ELR03261.1 hypothetical protein GMDG_06011 [Pseudogymnoascus destructans 20631-21]OAF56986.1 hypothetical protein VC83_05775 [Pseudogymnoascus destructans]
MRLHGDREPHKPQRGTTSTVGATCTSGADNEVWSYGPEVEMICKKYMLLREEMREYTIELMREAHEKGTPVIRTCFYEYPEDPKCWEVDDQYMYLCAPVLQADCITRTVYFSKRKKWKLLDGIDMKAARHGT